MEQGSQEKTPEDGMKLEVLVWTHDFWNQTRVNYMARAYLCLQMYMHIS